MPDVIHSLPEPVIRLGSFLLIFAALAVIELFHPRLERPEMMAALKTRRWLTNVGMLVVSSISLRLIFPAAAMGAALWAETQGLGLFRHLAMPSWMAGLAAMVILDLAVWFEHLLSHKVPLLWRIHRVHHSDPGFDVTTALRFHPIEIVVSMVWKALVVVALGAPVWAVLIFEIVLNGAAMFNHANLSLPIWLERWVRLLVVTPDMHRIHHSTDRRETDSNYGFNLSIWDRLFRTYTAEPALGQDNIDIGLAEYRDGSPARFGWSFKLPFVGH